MAFDVVNVGTTVNDGTGDTLRAGGVKINANFAKAVEAPASTVTNNTAVVFDGTTGKLVKQAGTSIAALAGKFAPTGNITAGNGMYLPAADTLAFSTAGVERLRVDSTGRLFLLGTTTETAAARVLQTEWLQPANTSVNNSFIIGHRQIAAFPNRGATVRFTQVGTTNVFGEIPTTIGFWTWNVGVDDGVERMRIAGNGNVIFGNGDTDASPAAATLRGTNASGNNTAGPNMTIQAGRGTGDQAGGVIAFQTSAAGSSGSTLNAATERMRIDSSGNVGIGTTGPASKLHIVTNVEGDSIILNNTNPNVSGNNAWGLVLQEANTTVVRLRTIRDGSGATELTNVAAGPLLFNTTNLERMRINAAGDVGIGTTSPGALFHSNGTIRYTNRPAAGTITTLGFDTNGDLKASSSSQRYKHNINTYNKGLTELLALRPVSFVYNGETRENIGFIAEEVNEAGLTEVMLYDDNDRPEGVMYANMVALLTKAIQELKVELDAVKVELAALKGA
jgi:hypothetical protein